MPFLNKAILIKILKTYPGADQIEARYNSFISECGENPPSFLQTIREGFKKGSSKLINNSSRWFGFNTAEDSEACYFEIRALIDDATKNKNLDAWTDILCTAGEGGYHRQVTSAFGSRLCQTSYALLMYIRNQVENKVKSIKDPKNTRDPDEILALQIQNAINNRIKETKQFINEAKENIRRTLNLKLSSVYSNKLETNVTLGQEFHAASLKMIEIAQRHLLILGDNTLEKDAYTKSSQEVFKGLPPYESAIGIKYRLNEKQVTSIQLQLPLYLQKIYPSLYLRDHRKDLALVVDEDKVIEIFESHEQIVGQEIPHASEQKAAQPLSSPAAKVNTPPQQIPDRSVVTRLMTPVRPEIQPSTEEFAEFTFTDVSNDKLLGILLQSPQQGSADGFESRMELSSESAPTTHSPSMSTPMIPLSADLTSPAHEPDATDQKHVPRVQTVKDQSYLAALQSESGGNGLFKTNTRKKHKDKTTAPTTAEAEKPRDHKPSVH